MLGPPLAFALSQDQTLQFDLLLYFVMYHRLLECTHGIDGLLLFEPFGSITTHTFYLDFKDRPGAVFRRFPFGFCAASRASAEASLVSRGTPAY